MKRRLCNLFLTAFSLAFVSAATSCIYEGEGDCSDRLSFTIQADWSDAPDASPEGMAYIFFPTDRSKPWRFDFPGREGGSVSMLAGEYRTLSYNDDTYKVLFRGEESYDSYEAYTAETASFNKDERTVECPDGMWGCAYCGFSLSYNGVEYTSINANSTFSPEFIFRASQQTITAHYTYTIRDVKNLSGAKSLSASLSGMAGSMFLASRQCGDYPSTLAIRASVRDTTSISGEFHTFGIPGEPSAENILCLYVVLKDDRRFCYKFDVTDQVRQAPDPMNVNILLDGVTLEIPESSGGTGFEVNVDGWETVIVNING